MRWLRSVAVVVAVVVGSLAPTDFAYAGAEIDPVAVGDSLISRSPGGLPVATRAGGAEAVLVARTAHGDVGYVHGVFGDVSATAVYDPFGSVLGAGAGVPIGFQSDYTDPSSGDVWMGARWYQPSTGGFASRDVVFGQLATPMSLNRYTYALGDPLGRWDPGGRCSKDISITYSESMSHLNVCTNDLREAIQGLEERRNVDLSSQFKASLLDGLRSVAENPLVSTFLPGADCAVLFLDRAQGMDSEGMAQVGCGLDVLPVVGKLAGTAADVGEAGFRWTRRGSQQADRAGDAAARADDVADAARFDPPSVDRVAPEPPVLDPPQPKRFGDEPPSTTTFGEVDDAPSPRTVALDTDALIKFDETVSSGVLGNSDRLIATPNVVRELQEVMGVKDVDRFLELRHVSRSTGAVGASVPATSLRMQLDGIRPHRGNAGDALNIAEAAAERADLYVTADAATIGRTFGRSGRIGVPHSGGETLAFVVVGGS